MVIYIKTFVLSITILVGISIPYFFAEAASLVLTPSAGTFKVGETFEMKVLVSSQGEPINAISATVAFPKDKLEVISISKQNSKINFWVQEPSFSNTSGVVQMEGVILNPGFSGSNGQVLSLLFKAKSIGSADLRFSSSSVLANDGAGTNVLKTFNTAQLTLGAQSAVTTTPISGDVPLPPTISSTTHQDPTKWYQSKEVIIGMESETGTTGYSILINQEPTTNPGQVVTTTSSIYKTVLANDGVWYAHVRTRNSKGWGGITHFKIQVDSMKPVSFEIKPLENDLKSPKVRFLFNAYDELSGIEKYVIQIDTGEPIEWVKRGEEIFETPILGPGKHTMLVKAFDFAGGMIADSTDFNIEGITTPIIIEYPALLKQGETLVIKGTTYPNIKVLVTFSERQEIRESPGVIYYESSDTAGIISREFTISDKNGLFTYISGKGMRPGVYTIFVEGLADNGAKSLPSETIRVMVQESFLGKIVSWLTKTLILVIPLFALLSVLGLMVWYSLRKYRNLKDTLNQEVLSTNRVVDQSFSLLEEDMSAIEKSGKEGSRHQTDLLIKQEERDMKDARELIERKISGIKRWFK